MGYQHRGPRAIWVVLMILALCAGVSLVPAWVIMLVLGALGWQWSYLLTLIITMLVPLCAFRVWATD